MSYFLCESIADLDRYLEHHGNDRKVIGHDTETTGLNSRKDHIVGASWSIQEGTGIYCPFFHKLGTNVDPARVVERIHAFVEREGYLTTYFNAPFDRTFTLKDLRYAPTRFRDVQEAAYLHDCERQKRDLKTLAKEDVGFDMDRFASLFTPEERKANHQRIDHKHPKRCVDYAGADADAPLRLDRFYDHVWTRHPFVVEVDTALVDIVACMQHEGGLEYNEAFVAEMADAMGRRWRSLAEAAYSYAGRKFNLDTPAEVGRVLFDEMGLTHPFAGTAHAKGKKGDWGTNAEVLGKLAETEPIAEVIISYRKVKKAQRDYFGKLQRLISDGTPPRFRLNLCRATTFRFTAPGGDPDVDGYTGMNAQAIGKGETRDLFGVDLSARGSASEYLDQLEADELMLADVEDELGRIDESDAAEIRSASDEEFTLRLAEQGHVVPADRRDEEDRPFQGLVCFRDRCQGCPMGCEVRGIDVTRRKVKGLKMIPPVRRAFQAPEGWSICSFDYDRQEMVIAANLSGERVWLDAMLEGKDLHAASAREAFGHGEAEWERLPEWERKEKRATGKSLNFGTMFGATAYTLSRRMGIPLARAEEVWAGFEQGLPSFTTWKRNVIQFARANGYTHTYFGRRRPLHRFYAQRGRDAKRWHSYADRCAVNTQIQGTGADVVRIAMVKVSRWFAQVGLTREEARLGLQIHDELMYLVRTSLLDQVVPGIMRNMEFRIPKWEVQLTSGAKVGRVWGEQEKWKAAA